MGCASAKDNTHLAAPASQASRSSPTTGKQDLSSSTLPALIKSGSFGFKDFRKTAPCYTASQELAVSCLTPLHAAAASGNVKKAQELVAAGADLEARDSTGCTPLLMATEYGHKEVVRVLLVAGAKVNARDQGNNTSLHFAARRSSPEVANLLLQAGADLNAKNETGYTAYAMAQDWGCGITRRFFDTTAGYR